MSDLDDKDLEDLYDEDFDYQKEIDAIEAQERELEVQRQKKKQELEKLRKERDKKNKADAAERKRVRKEKKKEEAWLGGRYDDEDDDDVTTVPSEEDEKTVTVEKKVDKKKQKKKGKKGIIILIILILAALIAAGVYAGLKYAENKTVSDFQEKVSSFQSEKLDGADLGVYTDYFNDFMTECNDAIEAKDVAKIAELEEEWSTIEEKYTDVTNGKTSLTAFVTSADETLAKFYVTSDYKDAYDQFVSDMDAAEQGSDYEELSSLQKSLDSLVTNLTAADQKQVQSLQNKINAIEIDSDYVESSETENFDTYKTTSDQAITDKDYATAIKTLKTWQEEAQKLADKITAQKESEAAKAQSESESRAKAESIAESQRMAAAESEAKAAAESKKAEESKKAAESQTATTEKSSSSSSSSGSSSSGDYVLANSSSKYLSASDVSGLSSTQLMYARNEIYARHGYIFNDSDLLAYFKKKSWYKPTVKADDFSATVFNDYEVANIALIRSYE